MPVFSTDDDFQNVFGRVLGQGEAREWRGLVWNVRFLDINDLIALQKRFPSESGAFSFDTNNLEQVRFFFYLALRKSDPRVSAVDLSVSNYHLSEQEVGVLLDLKTFSDPATLSFMEYLLVGSGLAQTKTEQADSEKNAPVATESQSVSAAS